MKKLFLAMMALAAMTFVGCKPQNEPEGGKDEGGETKVTCTDVKLFYEVKLTGNITNYVNLNMRYVEIPDSNNVAVMENMVSDWKSEEYTVKQGVMATYGLEPSIRVTEQLKQVFTDKTKYNTMVESNSTLVITMGSKSTFSDGRVDVWPAFKDSIILSEIAFDESKMGEVIYALEHGATPVAHTFLWDENDYINEKEIPNFWYRH